MKTMNFGQMEQVNGGSWVDRFCNGVADLDAFGVLLGVFAPALLNPASLALLGSASLSCYIRAKTGWWN